MTIQQFIQFILQSWVEHLFWGTIGFFLTLRIIVNIIRGKDWFD